MTDLGRGVRFWLGILSALALLTGCWTGPVPLRLRVLTYNVHHGEGLDGKLDLERLAAVIRAAAPDLVALQEVDRGVERSDRLDEPARLALLTGMEAVFEKNIPYQGGEYGNAVLSRLEIKNHENFWLPSFTGGEQRGALVVEVTAAPPAPEPEVDSGTESAAEHGTAIPIVFIATHFDYHPDDAERLASVDRIEEIAGRYAGASIILAGDLNATPQSAVLERLHGSWMNVTARRRFFTFPADSPDRHIDHVLVRPAERWEVVTARVIDEPVASDHRPVLVVLERK